MYMYECKYNCGVHVTRDECALVGKFVCVCVCVWGGGGGGGVDICEYQVMLWLNVETSSVHSRLW